MCPSSQESCDLFVIKCTRLLIILVPALETWANEVAVPRDGHWGAMKIIQAIAATARIPQRVRVAIAIAYTDK